MLARVPRSRHQQHMEPDVVVGYLKIPPVKKQRQKDQKFEVIIDYTQDVGLA